MKVINTNQLLKYKTGAAVCSEIRKKPSTQREQHVGILNVKPGET